MHLEIIPGTDTVLHLALIRHILEQGWEDRKFIEEWVANQIAGVSTVLAPVPRLRWASAEQITGSGGCNAFAGRAVVSQGALQVGNLAATGRLCVALPQGGQEDRFFAVLESARTVRLVDGQLVLEDAAGQILARFAKP